MFKQANTRKHVSEQSCSSVRVFLNILAHLAHLAQFFFWPLLNKLNELNELENLKTSSQMSGSAD